jgi:phosphatidylinositol glycan class F
MATRRSKKVSFDSASKIVEIDQETVELISQENASKSSNDAKKALQGDDFDPDTMDIDLTTGRKKRGANKTEQGEFQVEALATSLALIPYHLPLLLATILTDGQIMVETKEAIQSTFFNLSILSLIYSVLVGEMAKCERQPNLKSSGPTGTEFLYTACSYPVSILLAIPIYLTFLLFGAPAGPLSALTFYLGAHVSLIVFFPLLNVYKFTQKNAKKTWWKLLTFQVPNWKLNQVYCSSIGGLVGCWLGVIPIPLDWDRDWQDWPITLLIGSYAGAFVGGLASYLYGRYVMAKFRKNT